jgi:hypothetical protein
MTYPVNDFDSKAYPNISANGVAPTAIFDTMAIPQEGYALVLGIIASNKSTANRGLNLTLRKNGAAQAAHLLFDVSLPSQTAFQVIDGDKLVVRRGDVLSAWVDSAGINTTDLVISYVIYTPAS